MGIFTAKRKDATADALDAEVVSLREQESVLTKNRSALQARHDAEQADRRKRLYEADMDAGDDPKKVLTIMAENLAIYDGELADVAAKIEVTKAKAEAAREREREAAARRELNGHVEKLDAAVGRRVIMPVRRPPLLSDDDRAAKTPICARTR
jgi:hypothetical protein